MTTSVDNIYSVSVTVDTCDKQTSYIGGYYRDLGKAAIKVAELDKSIQNDYPDLKDSYLDGDSIVYRNDFGEEVTITVSKITVE